MLIKLRDGTLVEVLDCKIDLLSRIIYKNNYDKNAIQEEIKWVCKNNSAILIKSLLKMNLEHLYREMTNNGLKQGKAQGEFRDRAVEYTTNDFTKIRYTIAENSGDIRKVLDLRKKIFVNEEHYPITALTNGFEKESLHIMATKDEKLVGAVSISFDGEQGIPLDKYLDLTGYKKGKKNVEVDKLAIIGEGRKRELSFHLMWICYSIARYWGAQMMFIFTLSKKTDNLNIYQRFGFKEVGTFVLFDNELATALKLDFDDFDTYEKKLKTSQKLRLGKKLLNKFSLH